MLIYTAVALLITMIIGYLVETIKEYVNLKQVRQVNHEILKIINEVDFKSDVLDVFEVNRLRDLFRDRLVKAHLVDEFKIHKKDNKHIEMTYRKKLAIQSLELYFDRIEKHMALGELEYIENPFEEIHL